MARGNLKTRGFELLARIVIGEFSIKVIKLACSGSISKSPSVFLELTDVASVSRISS